MRWLKHLAMAHADIAIAAVLEEFGPEGYGIYWLLLEHFAALVDRDSVRVPSQIHSDVRWSQICHCSTRKFRNFVHRAAELKLIECKRSAELLQFVGRTRADRLQIDVPKLLKYRDEYSKKSGVTPDSREDTEGDKSTEGEQKKPADPSTPNLPRWKTDPDYREFVKQASAAWGDLIDDDLSSAYYPWSLLDGDQRAACLDGIHQRVEAKLDFAFVVRPVKFVKNREFYRRLKGRDSPQHGKSQEQTKKEEAMAHLERIKRDQERYKTI